MDYKYILQDILYNHKGKVLGILLGLLFGWFVIKYGIFQALFIAACVTLGYFLGKRIMDYKYILQDILYNHKGKVLGVLLGLLFGWFVIKYGIFQTLFIAACVTLGYFLGKRIDEKVVIKDSFDKLFK